MKKLLAFLRSMRFGILLLLLIAFCSVAGSMIPQGRDIGLYAESYPRLHGVLLLLGLNDVFSGWFFVLLMALLGLNLTLCSLIRIRSVVRAGKMLLPGIAYRSNSTAAGAAEIAQVETYLHSIGCKKHRFGDNRVYSKNLAGRYGSFLTHLSILLVLLFGAAGLYLPQVTDRDCLPGESIVMADGTEIGVHSFYIENESGQLDFTSEITLQLPDGRSKSGSIRVNYPMALGPYKVYQQNYGTAGKVRVTNPDNNGSDEFVMAETSFLSLDGVDGLWYIALYPDYYKGPNGEINPLVTYGRCVNPVYYIQIDEGGESSQRFALPGEELAIGALRYRFEEPVEYPGLRIKYTPPLVNTLLFLSFALMIVGLYMTFFMQPVLVKVDDEGYAVGSGTSEGIALDLQALVNDEKKEDNS
ncbi:MAG: cytochrome c biogenesis protein ResB [Ruminococcaceae bacterium]|nr:cytochrome c biogenesis protein ResB [Oscillospiraceae bacterium]